MTADPDAAGRSYAGEPLGERVRRRREQFLDAGLTLFGTAGYQATTVRALCGQARLTSRYFYESFPTPENLLVAVYERCMLQLHDAVTVALSVPAASTDPTVVVTGAVDAFFRAAEDARLARVVWLEVLGVSPRVDAVYFGQVDRFAGLLLDSARNLVPGWSADDVEGRIVATALVGAVSQATTAWLLSGYAADRATMVAAVTRVFVGTLAAAATVG